MKCQILIFRKDKKNTISLSSAEFVHSVVSVERLYFGLPLVVFEDRFDYILRDPVIL